MRSNVRKILSLKIDKTDYRGESDVILGFIYLSETFSIHWSALRVPTLLFNLDGNYTTIYWTIEGTMIIINLFYNHIIHNE